MNHELERIWKRAVMVQYEAPTAHDLPGGTQENKKPQSGKPVCKQRSEPRQY